MSEPYEPAVPDEPAPFLERALAGALTEPGGGESLADESPRDTDAGLSELAARSLHAPGSVNAPDQREEN